MAKTTKPTVINSSVSPRLLGPTELRQQMDLILKEIDSKPALRVELATDPVGTLQKLGFDLWSARSAADQWGLGPSADCGHDTCRLTEKCGWTVCGKTTSNCLVQEDGLRQQLDSLLARAESDPKFRTSLVRNPRQTLTEAGLDPWTARSVADGWGIGPTGDCGAGTCRLSEPCGWTICGKTTSDCPNPKDETSIRVQIEEILARARVDDKYRTTLIANPLEVLMASGLDPWSARGIADTWGLGPSADCGHDTCRLTEKCGWTVCGKTTSNCLGESSGA